MDSLPQGRYKVTTRQYEGGYVEATLSYLRGEQAPKETVPQQLTESDRLARTYTNRQRSRRRARAAVRRLIMAHSLKYLWTLTYAGTAEDLTRVLEDWRNFGYRMRRIYPEFKYVVVWELQQRGTWHLHFATNMYLNHSTVKRVWFHGHVFVSGPKRYKGMKLHQIATYLTKYISKDDGDIMACSRKYSVSHGMEIPEAVTIHNTWKEGLCLLAEVKGSSGGGYMKIFDETYSAWACSW